MTDVATASRSDSVWLDECLSVRDGELFIEACSAAEIARRFGTPVHVISENQLLRNVDRFQRAFDTRWPGEVVLLPSIKANPALALRRILTQAGTGCDAFGTGELEAALRTGTPPERISLNGPMKQDELLARAIRAGVRITLDSVAELDRAREVAGALGLRAKVRLRFRPELTERPTISEMSPLGATTREALDRYKAGIPTEDLLALEPSRIAGEEIELTGLHLHLGRHEADPSLWSDAADELAGLIGRLRDLWPDWAPQELDLGGGFPAPRDPFGRLLPQRADAPSRSAGPEAFAEAACPRLAERVQAMGLAPGRIRLELEPGRAIYADAGVHLATVGNVKRQTAPTRRTWVETDSSEAYLPDVNLEHSRWECLLVGAADTDRAITADVTGRTCGLDVIVPDAALPAVTEGEILAFLDTGAYQDAAANNFNALPRPGTVLVRDEEAELIRRHETLEDVFARDVVPPRLALPQQRQDASGAGAFALDHVSVTSADLDRSLAFYTGLLGLELRDRGEADGAPEFAMTGLRDVRVRWADLQLPNDQVLELLEYKHPPGNPVRPEPNDPGATHLALRVDDVDAIYERLRAAGTEVRRAPITLTEPGPWYGARAFYARDPDGVNIELIGWVP